MAIFAVYCTYNRYREVFWVKNGGFRVVLLTVLLVLGVACFVSCNFDGFTTAASSTSGLPATTLTSSTAAGNITTTLPVTSSEAPVTSSEAPVTSTEAVVTTTVVIITTEPDPTPEKPSEFIIYSIEMLGRYGDATLIKYGDFEILVDGGTSKDASGVTAALEKWVSDKHLDMLIVSHPDSDHIDGIERLSTFAPIESIGMIVQNGDTRGNEDFEKNIVGHFTSAVSLTIQEVMASDEYRTVAVDDAFSITFLEHKYYTDLSSNDKNENSIAFTVTFENTVLFMGGDMESGACKSLMEKNPELTSEGQFVIYKALHHASNGTNKADFLAYMKPDLCFVSTGLTMQSGSTLPNYNAHPYPEAIKRIAVHTTRIYWSSLIGNTTIICDGEDATVTSEGRTKDYYYQTRSESAPLLASRKEEIAITLFESRYYLYLVEYQGYTDYCGILKKSV